VINPEEDAPTWDISFDTLEEMLSWCIETNFSLEKAEEDPVEMSEKESIARSKMMVLDYCRKEDDSPRIAIGLYSQKTRMAHLCRGPVDQLEKLWRWWHTQANYELGVAVTALDGVQHIATKDIAWMSRKGDWSSDS
jgi:hypothetical protein